MLCLFPFTFTCSLHGMKKEHTEIHVILTLPTGEGITALGQDPYTVFLETTGGRLWGLLVPASLATFFSELKFRQAKCRDLSLNH
jgi:hypothetical protein